MSAADRPLPRPQEPGEPLFSEPWQAEVLAIAEGLIRAGLFADRDWSEALGMELARAEHAGRPDSEETYYLAALAALEDLVARRSPETGDGLQERVEAWRRAYLETPHGRPVVLSGSRSR